MTWRRAVLLAGIAVVAIVLLVVGRERAWWSAEEVERGTVDRSELPLRTEAGSGEDATLKGTGDEEDPAARRGPRRLEAQEGSLRLHYQQGWSFAKGVVVPVEEADLVFETCAGGISSVTLRMPGGGIANAGSAHSRLRDVKTARVLYEALVRGHPGSLRLASQAEGDSRVPASDVFLARTRRGEWVKLAIVERTRSGGWTEQPVTIVYTLRPDEPVFQAAAGELVVHGFEFDLQLASARDVEVQEEQARGRAVREEPGLVRLADLDARAARIQEAVHARGETGHHVSAVLARGFAREEGLEDDYRAATYSFEHETRDDRETTRNDWDFVFSEWNHGMWIRVCTVTDDRSLIRDLGRMEFDAALRGDFPPGRGAERVEAVTGHLYVLHTLDTESDYWVLFRIVEMTSREDMVFEWVPVEDPDPLRHAFGADRKELEQGYARIQVRSDHGGGNPHRAFLDGTKNAYVDELSTKPLDLSEPMQSGGPRSAAYVEGGLVPQGRAFLVEEVEVTIHLDGDEHTQVDSLVRVGPFPLVRIENDRRGQEEPGLVLFTADGGRERLDREDLPIRRRLRVRIPIRTDEEKTVFVEGASFTRNEVVLRGRLLPGSEAPASIRAPASLYQWLHLLQGILLDGDPSVPSRAPEGFVPWLRGLREMAVSGDYRRRLDGAIEALGDGSR